MNGLEREHLKTWFDSLTSNPFLHPYLHRNVHYQYLSSNETASSIETAAEVELLGSPKESDLQNQFDTVDHTLKEKDFSKRLV